MPRKKTMRSAKGTKMTAKNKKTTKAALPLTDRMEKDFRSAPARIAAEYRKEVVILKQQEFKLKTELKKAAILQKALKTKHTVLSTKKTATAKKQLTAMKKVQIQLTKAVKDSMKKLEQIQKLCKIKAEKQAKFTAISKQLGKLEKELSKKAPQITAKTTVKTKALKKTRKTSIKKEKNTRMPLQDAKPDMTSVTETEVETAELTS